VARMGFVLNIRPDKVSEYVSAHENVWPRLLDSLRDAGIHNYSIFMHGHQAFGYLESDDFESAWSKLAADDVNIEWQSAMADLLEARVADQDPKSLPEIFRLD
jgi:L-rhamnose mutarotase